jgi:uncharacterized integral membrane protein
MRALWWAAITVAAVLMILFAISNREVIPVGLWPLLTQLEMPLYLVLLVTLLVGFVVGQLVAWVAGSHWRREARRSRDRIAALESELASARTRIAP